MMLCMTDDTTAGQHPPQNKTATLRAIPLPLKILVDTGTLAVWVAFIVIAYLTGASNIQADQAQASELKALQAAWGAKTVDGAAHLHDIPVDPEAQGILTLVSKNRSYVYFKDAYVRQQLHKGPAIIPGSAPGPVQDGNFTLAGHRDGRGAPFSDIDTLKPCDKITVQTKDALATYMVLSSAADQVQRLTENSCLGALTARKLENAPYDGKILGKTIVLPTDVGVIKPVPNSDAQPPANGVGILTLVSCHPHWDNHHRIIIHAALVSLDRVAR